MTLSHYSCLAVFTVSLGGCVVEQNPETPFGSGLSGPDRTTEDGDTGGTSSQATDSSSASGTDPTASSATSASIKLDVGVADTTGVCAGDGCERSGCTAVDLLFIIDNSASMQPYQVALSQAFPTFANAITEGLAPGVNIHVGVTSTEMGFSASGSNLISFVNDAAVSCEATGDNDLPADSFYQTPDTDPSNINGAQGRLYQAAGMTYFALDSDAAPAEVEALETWFSSAAQIGEFGSQVEMSTAAAAWATDGVNSGPNAGFLRDEGAVLVLFFIQDEHDQTPVSQSATLIAKIASAKQNCGGFDCVVGGGFVNEDCLGLTPLGELFDALGPDAITETLPAPAAVSAQTFEAVLRETLAQVIVDTCNTIEPAM